MRPHSKLALSLLSALPLLAACGSGPQFKSEEPTAQARKRADGSVDDRSTCEWRGKADREASEVAGPGLDSSRTCGASTRSSAAGDDRHKVLICREIDTNFDGIKDVVRRYNEKGESIAEEADSNYDGKIDTWITFIKGRLAEVQLDTNYDGRPDEWKYYSNGKLVAGEADSNFDGKADVWEIYRDGHLERMGVDVDGDEHVDRWDHDNEMRRRFEEAERKKEEATVAAAQKKAADEKEAADKANEASGGDSPAKPAEGPKRKGGKKK